jgi:hypothetical protein
VKVGEFIRNGEGSALHSGIHVCPVDDRRCLKSYKLVLCPRVDCPTDLCAPDTLVVETDDCDPTGDSPALSDSEKMLG